MAMICYLFARIRRRILPALAVLLFSAVLAFSLCALEASNHQARERYEELYQTLPVKVRVTNLSGTKSDYLNIPGWVYELFTEEGIFSMNLHKYITDLDVKLRHPIAGGPGSDLMGISSVDIASELRQENRGSVTWFEGYDESVLKGEEQVCIVSGALGASLETVELHFSYAPDALSAPKTYTCTLKVVGTYQSDKGSTMIFCPLSVTETVFRSLGEDRKIDAIAAVVADNRQIPQFRKAADSWFAVPNPTGAKTEWGFGGYPYYPYALDLDDSLLRSAEMTLENSLFLNGLCTWLIFGLSVGAGFFISFLMVRQRKKEIALMRTLGTPTGSIFLGMFTEQALLVALGIFAGGAAFAWEPGNRLYLFGGVYFAGLLTALAVFLRNNLLLALKEE